MPLIHTSLITTQLIKTSSIDSSQAKTSSIYTSMIKSSSIINPQLISSSSVFSSIKEINNDIEMPVNQTFSDKKKEDIINNLEDFMKDYEKGRIYEIFGSDYTIKISPINTKKYSNISSYIDFSNCENLLRQNDETSSSSCLAVCQIEVDNKYGQSLVNEIDYAVFN